MVEFTYGWTEVAGGATTLHQFTVTEEQARGEGELAAYKALAQRAVEAQPRTMMPWDGASMVLADGTILSLAATGEVYLDGRRLGTARVAKLVQVGKSTYGRGATDGKWWRWSGTGWFEVPDFDARLLA
jgi:hypothetical protein